MIDKLRQAVDAALRLVERVDDPWLYAYAAESIPDQNLRTSHVYSDDMSTPELLLYDRENGKAWYRTTLFVDPAEVSMR